MLEFKKESFILFQQLTDSLYDDIASAIVRIVKSIAIRLSRTPIRSLRVCRPFILISAEAIRRKEVAGKRRALKDSKLKR